MIKFSDVVKANGRFWYVVLTCVIICFAILFGVAASKDTYTASATMTIEKKVTTEEEAPTISIGEIQQQVNDMKVRLKHKDFATMVISNVYSIDRDFASKLDAQKLSNAITVSYQEKTSYFEIKVEHSDKDELGKLINAITNQAKKEYEEKYPTNCLKELYSTQIITNPNQKLIYSIIGILVGIVLAEIIITCILAFNPYAENKELLERETGLKVIASISKVRRDK